MKKKRVMLLGNHAFVIYNFRKELIQQLLKDGYEVYLSMPYDDEKVPLMESWGCKYIETNVDRRGTNIFNDIRLVIKYIKLINKVKPDVVLTYTVKPNIYGGIACNLLGIPYINNITGLGSGFKSESKLKSILAYLYKKSLKNSRHVFFQNNSDLSLFKKLKIVNKSSNFSLIPGSGVNILEYSFQKLPEFHKLKFLFVGRIMEDKGINEYLNAAENIKKKYKEQVEFDLVGFIEPSEQHLENKINNLHHKNIINYKGYQKEVKPFIEEVHCLIQPSHGGEGISNVLLEAGAMGRILLASNIPGCKETIENDENGFLFEPKNIDSLVTAIEKVIKASNEEKNQYGIKSNKKITTNFNRNIVVQEYMLKINSINGEF